MSMLMMADSFKKKVGNPARKLVLLKLADNANDQGECWPSYGHIAEQCEMGRSTVKGHIKKLAEDGYLIIQERKNGVRNSSNMYKLTLDQGKEVKREKPKRPGKNKYRITPGQPLTPVSRCPTPRSAVDLPRSAVDPTPGQPLTPEPISKNQSVKQSNEPSSATQLRDGFDLFYRAGLPKVKRKYAQECFNREARKHDDVMAFAGMLADNIKSRLGTGELGFDGLHPSSYLNQQRWLDEVETSKAADPSITPCPHAELLAIWDDTCGQVKGKAPNLLDWQGTKSADALAERWAEFYGVEVNGRVRYDSLETGLEWWRMALDTIAAKQDFRSADVDIWSLFYKGRFGRAANGSLCGKGGATR